MSGGGKTVSRGRMGQSVTVTNTKPEDLDRMEQEVSQLENRVRELRQKQISLENQIAVLEPELQEMKMNYEKYNRELQVLKQQQPELAAQIKVQEQKAKSTKANPAEVEKLQQIVASKKSEYDEACATASVLQVEVDAVTKEIEEKTTSKIKAVDKSIKEATTLLNKCKAEITRLNVAIKTAERLYFEFKFVGFRFNFCLEQELENFERKNRDNGARHCKVRKRFEGHAGGKGRNGDRCEKAADLH